MKLTETDPKLRALEGLCAVSQVLAMIAGVVSLIVAVGVSIIYAINDPIWLAVPFVAILAWGATDVVSR